MRLYTAPHAAATMGSAGEKAGGNVGGQGFMDLGRISTPILGGKGQRFSSAIVV